MNLKPAVLMIVFASVVQIGASNTFAEPVTMRARPMIRLMNFDIGKGLEFKASLCDLTKEETADWSLSLMLPPKCVETKNKSEQEEAAELKKMKASGIGTLIDYTYDNENKKIKMKVTNLQPDDEIDPKVLNWSVESSFQGVGETRKILRHYNEFEINKENLKWQLYENATQEPTEKNEFHEKYQKFIYDKPENARYMAASLEILAILGVSTINYYSSPADRNPNLRDWDFKSFGSSMRARFTRGIPALGQRGVRFDDNTFRTNVGHYYAGVTYYIAARESGLNRLESLLLTFAASSFWEYFSEYREVVSINDQINTTLGGFILGEALHQIKKIFWKGPNTGLNRILRSIFGTPEKMSAKLQNKLKGEHKYYLFDPNEEQMDFWSKLDIYAQIEKRGPDQIKLLGFDTEVLNIPMFTEAGQARELLMDDTIFSKLKFELGKGSGFSKFKLFAKNTLAAIYVKNMGINDKEKMEGYQFYIGPSMALEIDKEIYNGDERNDKSDFRGIVHVLGATADMYAYYDGYTIHATMDIYGDFAMIKSWAFDRATNHQYANQGYVPVDGSGIQSVLRNEGYYYGAGATGNLSVVISKDRVSMGASYQDTRASIINARNRFYENVDVGASDEVQTAKGWVAYQLSKEFFVEFGAEKKTRTGAALGKTFTTKDIYKYGRLIYQY